MLGDARGRFALSLGLNLNWIGDAEFDLFSEADVLPVASLRAGVTFWQKGRWSALALLGGEYGGLGTAARGTQTHLDLGRILLGAEVRGHVVSGLVGYGRLLGGATILASRIGPAGDPDTLGMCEPAAAVSGALGAAVRLYGSPNGAARGFRLEAYLQGGYEYTSEVGLTYMPGPDGPPRPEPLDLGVLSASGPTFGFGFQGSY